LVKILEFFVADLGFGTNIPDPQHCNKNIVFPVIVIHTGKLHFKTKMQLWSKFGWLVELRISFLFNPPVSSISPESSLEYFWARVPPAFRRLHLKQQETNTRDRRMLTTETHTYITDLNNKTTLQIAITVELMDP
jgi:hypothetical protein